ncbi:phage tail sheath subtilisin-like domain-containing protein [Sporosarcina sp. SAFN-015]|uniref:phage tail sheath subtilisin-like domain-containing protein n=1 Tax=Sporosarcina sp. SAFN-015 TaxID=3387274 RepID=UPI003F7ED3F4
MANGGQWDPISLPIRPGLYLNFVEQALAQIAGGPRGVVGMPIFNYTGGVLEAGKFYVVANEKEAQEQVGAANAAPITRALSGGAAEVLIYAVPAGSPDVDYAALRDAFEARPFNVFVYPGEVDAAEQDASLAWVQRNRKEGKHFTIVYGGTAAEDRDPTAGNARSIRLADEYAVNLITGVVLGDGTELASAEYAAVIAGLIAGTPINKSITYAALPVADVTKRLRNSEINEALTSGSLVLVHDGRNVKVEQGITTDSDATKRGKIRITRARQAVATDIPATAKDRYIGKIDNNPAGQVTLIAAIKAYLETLETNNVLMAPEVTLDPQRESVGDCVFLAVSYVEVDSMERIFLTINV